MYAETEYPRGVHMTGAEYVPLQPRYHSRDVEAR